MADPNFVVDNQILWLEVPKSGTPPEWEPGTNYQLGDTVIPRSTFVLPAGKEDVMFQCVGFVGKSGGSQPAFPTQYGNTVIDNNIKWITRDPEAAAVQTEWSEYYQIIHNLTLS